MKNIPVLVLLLAACSAAAEPAVVTEGNTTTTWAGSPVPTETFGDDLPVEVYAPAETGPWPVVVLVHGGGWFGGQPSSTAPLAAGLADEGYVVFNPAYRTGDEGGSIADMASDVACAVVLARREAGEWTTEPGQITLMGHSAGAHLAALVALAPDRFGCGDSQVDALVGLAGPYDTDRVGVLAPLLGGTIDEVPDAWAGVNPFSFIAQAPDLAVTLVHGDADEVVPLDFSEDLADALTAVGRDVELVVVPGAGHGDMIDPARVLGLLTDRIVIREN